MGHHKEHKQEYKEHVDQYGQAKILRSWIDALENNHDLEVDVQDQHCTIPISALTGGDTRIEYEFDEKKGEHELELTLKW